MHEKVKEFLHYEGSHGPIVRVSSIEELSSTIRSMKDGAALLSNPLSQYDQDACSYLAKNRKLIKGAGWRMKLPAIAWVAEGHGGDKTSWDEEVKKRCLVESRSKLTPEQYAKLEHAVHVLCREVQSLASAVPGYTLRKVNLVAYSPRFFQDKDAFHSDNYEVDLDSELLEDEFLKDKRRTYEEVRILRTCVGNSTEFLIKDPSGKNQTVSAGPGGTAAQRLPSYIVHRRPTVNVNEQRLVLDLIFSPTVKQ